MACGLALVCGLDERRVWPYLAIMANRLLLTLLALLTGLAAQVAPAQARVAARNAEVGAVLDASKTQGQSLPAVLVEAPVFRIARHDAEHFAPAKLVPAWRAPTVLQGVDRARE